MGPLSFEPLPGMFSVCSEVRENALFDIGNPGKKNYFLAAAFDIKYLTTLQPYSFS